MILITYLRSAVFFPGIENVSYHCCSVQDIISRVLHSLSSPDVVAIVDPPRAGLRTYHNSSHQPPPPPSLPDRFMYASLLRSHSHCEKSAPSTCWFASLALITRSQFDDWRHIVHHWKANFHSFETIFPQDQKSRYAPVKYEFFCCSFIKPIYSVTRPTFGPTTTIKREIYNMRHSTSVRQKECNFLVEK